MLGRFYERELAGSVKTMREPAKLQNYMANTGRWSPGDACCGMMREGCSAAEDCQNSSVRKLLRDRREAPGIAWKSGTHGAAVIDTWKRKW